MKKDIHTWFEFNPQAHYYQPPDIVRTPSKISILIFKFEHPVQPSDQSLSKIYIPFHYHHKID